MSKYQGKYPELYEELGDITKELGWKQKQGGTAMLFKRYWAEWVNELDSTEAIRAAFASSQFSKPYESRLISGWCPVSLWSYYKEHHRNQNYAAKLKARMCELLSMGMTSEQVIEELNKNPIIVRRKSPRNIPDLSDDLTLMIENWTKTAEINGFNIICQQTVRHKIINYVRQGFSSSEIEEKMKTSSYNSPKDSNKGSRKLCDAKRSLMRECLVIALNNNHTESSFKRWFYSVCEESAHDIDALFNQSQFISKIQVKKKLSTNKKNLRNELAGIALNNGHRSKNHNGSCAHFGAWWAKVKDLPEREIRELFKETRFLGINPDIYDDPDVLWQAIEPVKASVRSILLKFKNAVISKKEEAEFLGRLYTELSQVVVNEVVAHKLVNLVRETTLRLDKSIV